MTEKPTKKEMYTEIGLSHDRGPSRDTGKATIVARRAKRVKILISVYEDFYLSFPDMRENITKKTIVNLIFVSTLCIP